MAGWGRPLHRNVLVAALVLASALTPAAARARAEAERDAARHAQAEALYQQSSRWLARNTVDARRQAVRNLEEAALLEPGNAAYQLALGRAYYASGYLRNARLRFEEVTRIQPGDAAGHHGLGLIWRRDWLKYLDHRSLDLAVDQFADAARLDSADVDAWIMLVPLLLEEGRVDSAADAAAHALAADPKRLECRLAVAHTAYRRGQMRVADSLFSATIPQLRHNVRDRFEDIGPVATEQDTMTLHHLPPAEQRAFVERFWRENDPDLSTPENEARLAYWSRATQAYFLFFDPKRDAWDERGEVYVRYGPPAELQYNPVGEDLNWAFSTGPQYPANLTVWNYPDLGMRVVMEDRLLSEFYLLPVSMVRDMDPVPDEDSLAAHGGALATRGLRGVFPLLPPGTRPLPVLGRVARFEGAQGPRVLAQLEAPGGPTDSLWADWAVLDSMRTVRSRASAPLGPSACFATTRQVSDFAADLEPGPHIVSVTVHDAEGRRGILRQAVTLRGPRASLDLSDVVVACGAPDVGAGTSVRIEPNPSSRVSGAGPLTAYFEIYHLQPGADGLARFEYVYSVRTTARDDRFWLQKLFAPNPTPAFSVSRDEVNMGALRRQFITVPVAALPPGRYRLEVTVRDLVSGDEVVRRVEFVKTG